MATGDTQTVKTSILMLTHNRPDAVALCLESLLQTLQENDVQLVILDNGSTGDVQSVLQGFQSQWRELAEQAENGRADDVQIIFSNENLGVAAGRARLVSEAAGEVLLFLDSDVVIHSSRWLAEIERALQPENVGVTGIAGSFVDWEMPGLFFPALYGQCDVVSGWCMAVKRDVFNAGVAFDVGYGKFYEEDSDLCLQARAAGWDVWSTGGIGVHHVPANSGAELADRAQTMARLVGKWKGRGLIRAEGGY